MTLDSLEIHQFRNLHRLSLRCAPRLNVVIGANAAGKTSLLEAIYFLSRTRSFRTGQARELIASDAKHGSFRVVAMVNDSANGRRYPIGVERGGQTLTARIDGRAVRSLAELAARLPVLLLDPGSHRLLEDGPSQRRSFMDWGLFHREARFMPAWKRYRTALKHRNAALRAAVARNADRDLLGWEKELAAAADTLDQLRSAYCELLQTALAPFLTTMLGGPGVIVDYRRGWPQEQDLLSLLARDRDQERQQGYTRYGPHRADFLLKADESVRYPLTQRFSRGQQKLLICALILAQAELFLRHHGEPCILLIDDLPAELDERHRHQVMMCLAKQRTQLFISAIDSDAFSSAYDAWSPVDRQLIKLSNGEIEKTA